MPSRAPGTGPRTTLALVGLQRIYLALNIDYYPVNEVGTEYENTGIKVSDTWEFNLAAGWRFLF